jgi:flagellar capping protein FliD
MPNLMNGSIIVVNTETAKQQIKGLVEKYNKVVQEDRIDEYNEETTKIGFIQPLFHALGWDFENSSEVTAEETISKKESIMASGLTEFQNFSLRQNH